MYKISILKDKCKGCYLCLHFCPKKVLGLDERLNKKGLRPVKVVSEDFCTGCGFCFLICPDTCIEIYEEESADYGK